MNIDEHASRLCRFLRPAMTLLSGAMAALVVSGQVAVSEPAPIVFKNENRSDGGGVFNVIQAFREACLTYPATADLPKKIAPEGFKVVTQAQHWGWAPEEETTLKTLVISKTGLADNDEEGGYPFISLSVPENDSGRGLCLVEWKRAWDYPEDTAKMVSVSIAALMDSRISYFLGAVLNSVPERSFMIGDRYLITSDWYTPCMEDHMCYFSILGQISQDEGIEIKIDRGSVERIPVQ